MNIVLVGPDIPWNTGNIGRTCVGTQSTLHLVGKLGFSLKDKYLKRAGLDYWEHLNYKVYKDWNAFLTTLSNPMSDLFFFEKDAGQIFWDAQFVPNAYLIFGSETRGFPNEILSQYQDRFYKIPMSGPIRSLNLSSAVAVVLYEAIRQVKKQNLSVDDPSLEKFVAGTDPSLYQDQALNSFYRKD